MIFLKKSKTSGVNMSKIHPLEKTHIFNNSQKILQVCIKCNSCKYDSSSIQDVLQAIYQARSTIFIASTSFLDEKIKDALTNRVQSKVRIYGLVKTFESFNVFGWFGKQFPFLCRQCPDLKNDYIIIDNQISFLFLKPMENIQDNTSIQLNQQATIDLSYWFIHFFWTKCNRESINGKPDICKEAPFAVPSLKKEFVMLNEKENIFPFKEAFYACEPNSKFLISKDFSENLDTIIQAAKISHQLKSPIYKNEQFWLIGDLLIPLKTFPGLEDIWLISKTTLSALPSEFIDFNSTNWDTVQKKSESQKKHEALTANSLEEMENLDLNDDELKSKADPYSEKNIFHFTVKPPQKPNNAKRAEIYKDFENLQNKYIRNLEYLKSSLIDLMEKGTKNNVNIGIIQSINEAQNDCTFELKNDLSKMTLAELENCLGKWDIEQDSNWLVKFSQLDYRVSEDKFNKDKKDKLKSLTIKKESLENELTEAEKELAGINLQLENLNKDITSPKNNQQKELEQKQNSLKRELEKLRNSLASNQQEQETKQAETFNRKSAEERLKEIRKELSFLPLKKPAFLLPEIGELFEDNKNFYLEISDWEDLQKAKELSQRYKTKSYYVVAKV